MNDNDLKKIGDELVKVLTPVYEWQDKTDKRLDEFSDKIDALTVDVHHLQQDFSVHKDQETLEHDKIKRHIGMPTSTDLH